MKQLFKAEAKVSKVAINELPKDYKDKMEKDFIINFLGGLPIEGLKELINFKEIDFENKDLWAVYENQEMLTQLRYENVLKFSAELSLETDS